MTDASQFYTNRVLKDFKEKDPIHTEWVKQWLKILNELYAYVKQYHTTGLTWGIHSNGLAKNSESSIAAFANIHLNENPPKNGVMNSITSLGLSATSHLKKIPDELKVHKNPQLKEQPIERTNKSQVYFFLF